VSGNFRLAQRAALEGQWRVTVKAKIHVTLKPGILDPQGKAIEQALATLGYTSVGNVRVGKYMELELEESAKDQADAQVKAMCERLLANTVIEEYRYELATES
jgi:phosphoribosylformylglycinamidine synthase subunit PurS